jgi:hypothetical protein
VNDTGSASRLFVGKSRLFIRIRPNCSSVHLIVHYAPASRQCSGALGHRFQPRSGRRGLSSLYSGSDIRMTIKSTQMTLLGAPSLPYSSRRPVRPPHGRPRSALSQPACTLACAHAHKTLIWASKSKGARPTFNYVLVSSLEDPTAQVSSVRRISSVPKVEKLHGYHPTQKPLRSVRRAVLASMEEGNLVFDHYTGSGTTAMAKELNRAFIGVELEEEELARLAARRIAATQRGSLLRELPEQPWSNA